MDTFNRLLNQAKPLANTALTQAQDFAEHAQTLTQPALNNLQSQFKNNFKQSSHPASSTSSTSNLTAAADQPEGTYLPGAVLRVNNYTVSVERYLAQGGFAHVYLVSLSSQQNQRAVLKRILCHDAALLEMTQNEVNFMKAVNGNQNIVSFFDASVTKQHGGTHEVFILMEYCSGGTLIDYMNTRLHVRLTEHEIFEIFADILRAVHHLHTGTPVSPIIHRDLKIENVLIGSTGAFKVCDFGSCTTKRVRKGTVIPTSDIRKFEDEVERVTTLQYRPPELCDLYVRAGISEKVDVWALGVLLYKLCYYTTPFEEKGKLAILNGVYETPNHPQYSNEMSELIARMLVIDPAKRPNVYQVYANVCSQLKIPVDLNPPAPDLDIDITVPQETKTPQIQQIKQQPSSPPVQSVAPMRRGRPVKGSNPATDQRTSMTNITVANDPWEALAKNSSPSPVQQNNPWAVLDDPPAATSAFKLSNASASISKTDSVASFPALKPGFAATNQDFDGGFSAADDFGGGVFENDDYDSGGDDENGKYAEYFKSGAGGDSDDEEGVASVRKGVEKVKVFSGKLFGGTDVRKIVSKVVGGAGGEGYNIGGGFGSTYNDVSASGFAEEGFASLKDEDEVGGSGWADELNFGNNVETTNPATPIKKAPPPIPPKAAGLHLVPASSGTQPQPPQAQIPASGSFWATESAGSTVATGWASEEAFETAFSPSTSNSISTTKNSGAGAAVKVEIGWADNATFENGGALSAASSETPVSPTLSVSSAASKKTGVLANNAFLLADQQQQQQTQKTAALLPGKKSPPPPAPLRKSSEARLRSRSIVEQNNTVAAVVAKSGDTVPPPKPMRRKPLPQPPSTQ
ncbi:hypothetical protein HK100_005352 [Physocladia obscura]|uniref:non-specific serine/threonine protein kinase n=1 Tax=Physocladia obscura TaxID=109957 RepID=A0AAD5SRS0_9FUNG|nr:hypothetical protein HK100_005352 [Physocladia obscura]